jgi:uncharacterized protein (TIGR02391 family)
MDHRPGDVPGLPRLDELSPTDRTLLDYGVTAFLDGQEAPDLETVRWREAREKRSFDVQSIYSFPSELGRFGSRNEIEVSIGGLRVAIPDSNIIPEFIKVVHLCVRTYLQLGPQARLEGAAICDQLDLSEEAAARLGLLMGRERYVTLGGNPPPADGWFWQINPEVARFDRVRTTVEFFEKRAEVLGGLVGGHQTPAPVTTAAGVPPFSEYAAAVQGEVNYPLVHLDSLHPAIADAVIDLVSRGQQSHAVLQAALAFRDVLRSHTGLVADGTDLVNQAFATMEPEDTTRAAKNRFEGTKSIALGMVLVYRNNPAHELAGIDEVEAAEAVATFSLLARNIQRLPVSERETA